MNDFYEALPPGYELDDEYEYVPHEYKFGGKLKKGFKKLKKGVKKVAKVAAPFAPLAMFIPGVGPLAAAAIAAGTSKLGGQSWGKSLMNGAIAGGGNYLGAGKLLGSAASAGSSMLGAAPTDMPLEGFGADFGSMDPMQGFGDGLGEAAGKVNMGGVDLPSGGGSGFDFGGALGKVGSSVGNWGERIWNGDPQATKQANMLLGGLGMIDSFKNNSNAQTPAQLQASVGGGGGGSWTPQQQAAANAYFSSPPTRAQQPPASYESRYGVNPYAPKYAHGGKISPLHQFRLYADGGEVDPSMMDPSMMDPSMMDPSMMDPSMGGGMDPSMMDPSMGGGMDTSMMDPSMMDPSMMDPSMMDPSMMEQGPESGGGAFSGYVGEGQGGGQDDMVQAMLSPGEYVLDADVVSALGDGSNEAGAAKLDQMREAIRAHKRGAANDTIPPRAKAPLSYMAGA